MQRLKSQQREHILKQLRQPGPAADRLIYQHLGLGGTMAHNLPPYTSDVETALKLLPQGQFFLCGRSEDSEYFWCDVGFRPKVQAWGTSLAAAVAGAIFAYLTHPEVAPTHSSPNRMQ